MGGGEREGVSERCGALDVALRAWALSDRNHLRAGQSQLGRIIAQLQHLAEVQKNIPIISQRTQKRSNEQKSTLK